MGKRKKKPTLATTVPTLGQMMSHFWPLIRKQRMLLSGSFVALLLETAVRLLEPWPIKFVLDRVIVSTPTGGQSGIPVLDNMSAPTLLAVCAGAILLIAVLKAMLSYCWRVGFALGGNNVLSECRGQLFSHLTRLSLSFHDTSRTGDLITRITGDIGRLKEVAITAMLPLFAQILTLTAMLVVMFIMDWRLAIIVVAVMPFFLISTKRIGGRIRQVARKQRARKGEMGATAAEAIGSIKVVQSLSLENIHEQAFSSRNKSDLKEGVRAKRLSARLVGTADVLIAVGTAAVLWLGAGMVLRGELTPGDLIVFLTYLKISLRPIRNLAKYSGRIAKASASAERIIEVLEMTPQIQDRPDAVPAPDRIESVAFEEVSFGYKPEQLAVRDISLRAEPGDVIVFAGPSGAGKSTILNLLLRLYDPTSGRVAFNDHDLREYTVESVRRRISVVPQENVLFAVSIRDNIAYGAPGATEEQIIAAARLARAHDFISELPEGYDTVVGERGGTLSEGQRQRVAIARAAIRQSPILVMDEPTSSLDAENNRMIREAIRQLSEDRITFVIAHNLSTVLDENRVIFLDHGGIVEEGTHRELLERGGRYASMYQMQHADDIVTDHGRAHAVRG